MADAVDLIVLRTLPRLVACSVATFVALGGLSAVASADSPELRLARDTDSVTVEAAGLEPAVLTDLRRRHLTPEDWQSVFPVYTGHQLPTEVGKPAVAGTWAIAGNVLRFRPRYPLVPGLAYVARLDLSQLQPVIASHPAATHATFKLPAEAAGPPTVVRQIYPTATVLPENLLRLYLHFSAPMGRGEAYQHVRLLDAEGSPVDRPFLEVGEELWDPGMRRMTLFFDPGRIKRGLRPHLEAGPPLRQGASYTLVVDPGWRDAKGRPLASGFEKAFTVSAPDREALSTAEWSLDGPTAGSREPVVLSFPRPLDHGLLQRVVRVLDAHGEPLAGEVEIGNKERSFTFRPERPWRAGAHSVAIETILEDVAGNNLKQAFDLDVQAAQSAATKRQVELLSFSVAAR